MFATLLAHQAHCALPDFRGKLRYLLVHGSILSGVGASTKSGAVHYVLVRAADNRIKGIVTSTDLNLQFQQLSEPFLLLGEIENFVRSLIDGKFTLAELRAIRDAADGGRPVESVADLTLGEIIRLVENPERWQRIGLQIDRVIFKNELERIRLIRNDVMHFDPDPISVEDHQSLRAFVHFLHQLQRLN
jgi:hypothetical protein